MDFTTFVLNFLVDEVSGDSEYDSVGAAGSVAWPDLQLEGELPGGCDRAALLDDGDDDRESAVDAGSDTEGSEMDGGEDGSRGAVGDDSERDEDDVDVDEGGGGDDDGGEEESMMRWWSTPPEVDHTYEEMEEETGERRKDGAADLVEEARERDRRFWETCLASGYP